MDPSTRSGLVGTKPWYQSLGTWGGLAALLGSVLGFFKYEVDAAFLRDLSDWFVTVVTAVGAAAALWGRLRASKRLTVGDDSLPPVPPQNWKMNSFTWLSLSLTLFWIGGCANGVNPFASPAPDYVAADKATFEAVAPEYAAYVAADPSLDAEQIARRQRTVATWRLRIEQGEKRSQKPEESSQKPEERSQEKRSQEPVGFVPAP